MARALGSNITVLDTDPRGGVTVLELAPEQSSSVAISLHLTGAHYNGIILDPAPLSLPKRHCPDLPPPPPYPVPAPPTTTPSPTKLPPPLHATMPQRP